MPSVNLRENGEIVEVKQRHKDKFHYITGYIANLMDLLDRLNIKENVDIEINLVEWGNLGSELLLDNRLDSEKVERSLNSIKNLSGITFYYMGLQGSYLLEEYKDQEFCYIQLQQTYLINMTRIAFHEIHHFCDPFTPREWQTILDNGQCFTYYEKTIEAYTRLGLNEYYANLYAFSRCLILINEILKDRIEDSEIELYNKALLEKIPAYLNRLGNKLDAFISNLKVGVIEELPVQNPKADLINFLWSEFFHQFYYFLGAWKIYKERNLDIIQKVWDSLIQELQELNLSEMNTLLNSFKDLLLEDLRDENELADYIDTLFLDYYHSGLEIDFLDVL